MPVELIIVTADCARGVSRAARSQPGKDYEPPPLPPECKLFHGTILEQGLPIPGSKEFCKILPEIERAFENSVNALFAWFDELQPSRMITKALRIPVDEDNDPFFYRMVANFWNSLVGALASSVQFFTDFLLGPVKTVVDIFRCLSRKLGGLISLGIWLFKQLLSLVEQVDIGFNFAAVLELHIGINVDFIKTWLDLLADYFAPIEVPSAGEATVGWLHGTITLEQRDCIYRLHGLSPETMTPLAMAEREQLDWREAIQYVRRTDGRDGSEEEILRVRGFVHEHDVRMAKEMYWELPSISDHLHWLQRQVFDKEYVERYKLMTGFEDKFWPVFGKDLTSLGMRKEYAEKHYAAHWIMPSPEQMKEFIYRTKEIKEATGEDFGLDDFDRILAEQDYNVLARKWFKATAYQVPAISYVKEWYRQNIINRDQLEEYHRRLGFTPGDAKAFADIDDIQKKRMRTTGSHGWTARAATDAWFAGLIDSDSHDLHYSNLGYTQQEARDARDQVQMSFKARSAINTRRRSLSQLTMTVKDNLQTGVLDARTANIILTQGGWDEKAASAFVYAVSSTAGTRRVKQAISYIRSAFLQGRIDLATAQRELNTLTITPQAIQQYIGLWRLQFTPIRKRRSADHVVTDLANGHVTQAQAVVMLRNLGYSDADTRLYLADAQQKLQKIVQGRLQAQQKTGLARSKQQAQLAKEAGRQRKAIIAEMKKEAPVATLKKWAKLGIIGRDLFTSRMRLYGFSPIDIDRYYKEACSGKGEACVEETPGAGSLAVDSGGGGDAKK